jgi:hypothetical protein
MELSESHPQFMFRSQCQQTDPPRARRIAEKPKQRVCSKLQQHRRHIPQQNQAITCRSKVRFSHSVLQLYGGAGGFSRSFVGGAEASVNMPRSEEAQPRRTPLSVFLLATQRECLQRQLLMGCPTGSLLSTRGNREPSTEEQRDIGVNVSKKKLETRTFHHCRQIGLMPLHNRCALRFNSCRQLCSDPPGTLTNRLCKLPISHPKSADSLLLAEAPTSTPRPQTHRRVVFSTSGTRAPQDPQITETVPPDAKTLPLLLPRHQDRLAAGVMQRLLGESSGGSSSTRNALADKDMGQEFIHSISRTSMCNAAKLARVSTCPSEKPASARYKDKEHVSISIPSPRLYLSSSS